METLKRFNAWIIITIAIVIAVIVIAFFLKRYHDATSQPSYKPGPTIVKFIKAKTQYWQSRVLTVGTVYAHKGIMLRAEYAGNITKIFVKSGQSVEKDQALFQVNPKVLQAQLKQQLAALKLARVEYERYYKLGNAGTVSQEKLDETYKTYLVAKNQVEQTEQQLALTRVSAPFSGYFGLTRVHVGDYVNVGDDLGYLQTKDDMYVQLNLPAKFIPLIHTGDTILVQSEEKPTETFKSPVYAVDSSVDPDTRMITLRSKLNAYLTPGSYVEATVLYGKKLPVIVLPQEAVVSSVEGEYVYRVIDGKAVKTIVKTGQRRGNSVEVISGLQPGQTVIDGGQIKVIPGFPVTDKGAITSSQKGTARAN